MPTRFVVPIVRLNQEDIDEIVRVLQGTEATFVFNGYASKDPSALIEKYNGSRVEELDILCRDPSITIHIGPSRVNSLFYYDDENLRNLGIWSALHNILRSAERRPLCLYGMTPLITLLLILSIIAMHKSMAGESFDAALVVYVPVLGACMAVFLWGLYVNILHSSSIMLVSKYKEKGFLERNRDHIIRDALIAVFSSLFTLIAQYLISRFGN